jgi:hypothetical protein
LPVSIEIVSTEPRDRKQLSAISFGVAIMKRVLLLAGLICGGLIGYPRPASASLMDWLQELSGPGPFNGRAWNAMLDVCPERGISDTRFFVSEYDDKQPVRCIFFDKRRFVNIDGDNFGAGRIDVGLWELGGSANVHRAVAIGFGFGRVRFKSQGGEKETWVLTAPRIIVKPAMLFGAAQFWHDHEFWRTLASVVKYYVKNNVIAGRLTGADFGLKAGDANFNFVANDDQVWSRGFIIDLTEPVGFLLRRLQ